MTHNVDDGWKAAKARLAIYTVLNIIVIESPQFIRNSFTHVENDFSAINNKVAYVNNYKRLFSSTFSKPNDSA